MSKKLNPPHRELIDTTPGRLSRATTAVVVGQKVRTKSAAGVVLASWWSCDCGEWKHAIRLIEDSPVPEIVILESEIIPDN